MLNIFKVVCNGFKHIKLQDIKILSTKPCHMDGLNREMTEIKLHPNMIRGRWPDCGQSLPAPREQRRPLQLG